MSKLFAKKNIEHVSYHDIYLDSEQYMQQVRHDYLSNDMLFLP